MRRVRREVSETCGERDNVDVHAKLAELRRAVEQARSMPMSASAVVNRAELLAMIDEVSRARSRRPSPTSQRVLADRDAVVDEGRREAEQIVADAHERAREDHLRHRRLPGRQARGRPHPSSRPRAEADELRKETDDYVDAKLANFEITLERTTEAVKRGRERLAGRSAFDALTSRRGRQDQARPSTSRTDRPRDRSVLAAEASVR